MFHHSNRGKIDDKSRKIMIFAKKKILVWCDDPPEDWVISIFAGCLANHDRAHSLYWCDFAELIYWCNGSILNTEFQRLCSRAHLLARFSVSCKASFDFFVDSPMRGNIHQQDYFMFLGFQVLHRDLESIFLMDTVGIWST